jgi:N-acetylmuramoyl-L-alanine amidase
MIRQFIETLGLSTEKFQLFLKNGGLDPGPIDGIWGSKTEQAGREFFAVIVKETEQGSGKPWTHLMIHCAASRPSLDVTPEHIRKWHIEGRGWSRVGYSHLFRRSGQMDILIPYDRDDQIDSWEISNGARAWNGFTKHICYAGGVKESDGKTPEDNRTSEQRAAMDCLVKVLIMLYPDIKLIGHNQVANKACPSFDVPTWAREIGISEKNIDSKIYR